MFEHRSQPIVPKKVFYHRLAYNFILSLSIMLISLLIGVLGYHFWGDLGWIDSVHNASMILSGMGLVDHVNSTGGKIFSSVYSLFSGIVFITNLGILLAPAAHRLIHKFHLEEK